MSELRFHFRPRGSLCRWKDFERRCAFVLWFLSHFCFLSKRFISSRPCVLFAIFFKHLTFLEFSLSSGLTSRFFFVCFSIRLYISSIFATIFQTRLLCTVERSHVDKIVFGERVEGRTRQREWWMRSSSSDGWCRFIFLENLDTVVFCSRLP